MPETQTPPAAPLNRPAADDEAARQERQQKANEEREKAEREKAERERETQMRAQGQPLPSSQPQSSAPVHPAQSLQDNDSRMVAMEMALRISEGRTHDADQVLGAAKKFHAFLTQERK